MWLLPSPARHGGCKKDATAAPLALSLDRERDLEMNTETEPRKSQTLRPFRASGFLSSGRRDSPRGTRRMTAYSYRGICGTPRLSSSANHSDSSGLARSLALSFSRVAAARRIPVLPHVLQRNSGFLARARHARGNDRKIRPSGRACHYLVQDSKRKRLENVTEEDMKKFDKALEPAIETKSKKPEQE